LHLPLLSLQHQFPLWPAEGHGSCAQKLVYSLEQEGCVALVRRSWVQLVIVVVWWCLRSSRWLWECRACKSPRERLHIPALGHQPCASIAHLEKPSSSHLDPKP
jgi:hypothetical protein